MLSLLLAAALAAPPGAATPIGVGETTGALVLADARAGEGVPLDRYEVTAPTRVWVELRVRAEFVPRLRAGGVERVGGPEDDEPRLLVWSGDGGTVTVEVLSNERARLGPYVLDVRFVPPVLSAPPEVSVLTSGRKLVGPSAWAVDGLMCDLVTLRAVAPGQAVLYAEAAASPIATRPTLVVGQWGPQGFVPLARSTSVATSTLTSLVVTWGREPVVVGWCLTEPAAVNVDVDREAGLR